VTVQNALLAAAPLTKTALREQVVVFLDPPFMAFDLAILMRKRDAESSSIQRISDLAGQTAIKFGVTAAGSTAEFFRSSPTPAYRVLLLRMEANSEASYVRSVEEGVRRVREAPDDQPFVFIGEQHMLEYHASRQPCDLAVVRGTEPVYEAGYHLAVGRQLDRETANRLAAGLQRLKDAGRLDALYQRWWTDRVQCSQSEPEAESESGESA